MVHLSGDRLVGESATMPATRGGRGVPYDQDMQGGVWRPTCIHDRQKSKECSLHGQVYWLLPNTVHTKGDLLFVIKTYDFENSAVKFIVHVTICQRYYVYASGIYKIWIQVYTFEMIKVLIFKFYKLIKETILLQGGIGLNVAQMIVELIRDKRKIVDRITKNNIDTFIELLRTNKARLLRILKKNVILSESK